MFSFDKLLMLLLGLLWTLLSLVALYAKLSGGYVKMEYAKIILSLMMGVVYLTVIISVLVIPELRKRRNTIQSGNHRIKGLLPKYEDPKEFIARGDDFEERKGILTKYFELESVEDRLDSKSGNFTLYTYCDKRSSSNLLRLEVTNGIIREKY